MKTFEQHLHEEATGCYPLRDILDSLTDDEIEDSVKTYAKEYAREALRNAAENATMEPNGMLLQVDKESITQESNLPEI